MSKEQQKRHKLLSKLRLKMCYTAPVLALVAGGDVTSRCQQPGGVCLWRSPYNAAVG